MITFASGAAFSIVVGATQVHFITHWGYVLSIAALGWPFGLLGGVIASELSEHSSRIFGSILRAALGGALGFALGLEIVLSPLLILNPLRQVFNLLALAILFGVLIGLAAWIRKARQHRRRTVARLR